MTSSLIKKIMRSYTVIFYVRMLSFHYKNRTGNQKLGFEIKMLFIHEEN